MEASAAVPMDCDVEKEMEEDEDLEFFQKSIKVHDRFGGNCEEEDEFYSDDDEPDEPTSCQKGGYLKPVGGFSRSVLTSETKLETISMLDNARSSCSKSGHDLSLEMLNLKSDDVGLGDLDGRAFLGKSILGSSPPFGDPLSEMDILDSALSLLDDKTCEKFREKGLFDGLVDKNGRIIDSEMMANENYICDVEAKLDMVSSEDKLTLEPFRSICDSPKNLRRPTYDFTREDVSKPDVHPSTMAEPLGPLLSSQLKKTRQSKSVNSSRKQLNDSDSMDSKGSVGREYPPNNLSLDDLVRYINGESLKKVCNRKTSTPSSSSTLPPQTNTANTKKMKKQAVNKHDVATTSKVKVPPATSRVRKTTKKASHVGTEDFTKDSPQEAFFDVDNTTAGSTTATLVTASAKGTASTCNAEHDDENAGQEEFIAVLHKRRVKTRKEPVTSRDMHPACVVSPQTRVAGQRQPEKTSSARNIDRDLGASSMSVFSVSSKSYRSDTSGGGSLTSKRGSLSSLDESPPLATYDTSALGASARDEEHAGAPPYYRPSFSKFSAGSSYASALLQNMPKFSVTGSRDVSQTEPRTVVAGARFSSPLNSEAENEMLLSPPQSEADTGFSSSSSLSPDDAHVSLTSDSTMTTSKGNETGDSESRSHPLESRSHPLESRSHPLNEESSTLMQTSDGDVRSDDFEQKVEECVVDDSVSRDISDLDFPRKTHISELSERTDKMHHHHHHHHNAGESSLACSCRESSCAAATQSKNSPVIFDTRIRAVTRRMSNADIVFLFDADDMSDVVNYVAVDDIDGITFTSSPDGTPLETGALEMASILSTVEASSSGTKTIVESYGFEVTDKLDVECQLEIQVTDDQARCDERVPLRDSEYGNAVSGDDGRSVERRTSSVGKAAVRSAPRGSFDLLAAQKFFSQAFKSVLKREHECPGQVVRL